MITGPHATSPRRPKGAAVSPQKPTAPILRVDRGDSSDPVATLVIDNPTARNGLTAEACREGAAALASIAEDPAVRAVVVTGAGAHFCSGADLRTGVTMLRGTDDAIEAHVRAGFHTLIEAIWRCPKPTLAVIRGACVGFGFDLALACDLRLAADDASLGQVFTRIGLVPDGGSSFILPRLVGLGRAMELMLFAKRFDGATAASYGLVNRSVPSDELGALAEAWSTRLAAGPPIAYLLGKANLRAGAAGGTLEDALDREAAAQVRCIRSKDMGRGLKAFFTKTEPDFRGD